MRANHFDYGMADPTLGMSSHLVKKDHSEANARVKDFTSKEMKKALDKESWGHGVTEVPKYHSVNTLSYPKFGVSGDKKALDAEVGMLK